MGNPSYSDKWGRGFVHSQTSCKCVRECMCTHIYKRPAHTVILSCYHGTYKGRVRAAEVFIPSYGPEKWRKESNAEEFPSLPRHLWYLLYALGIYVLNITYSSLSRDMPEKRFMHTAFLCYTACNTTKLVRQCSYDKWRVCCMYNGKSQDEPFPPPLWMIKLWLTMIKLWLMKSFSVVGPHYEESSSPAERCTRLPSDL